MLALLSLLKFWEFFSVYEKIKFVFGGENTSFSGFMLMKAVT